MFCPFMELPPYLCDSQSAKVNAPQVGTVFTQQHTQPFFSYKDVTQNHVWLANIKKVQQVASSTQQVFFNEVMITAIGTV